MAGIRFRAQRSRRPGVRSGAPYAVAVAAIAFVLSVPAPLASASPVPMHGSPASVQRVHAAVHRGPGRGAYGSAPVSLDPSSLSFGDQPLGATSRTDLVTVKNTSRTTLGLGTGKFQKSGGGTAQFGLGAPTPPDPCGGKLAPGASCQVSLTFTPLGLGPQSGEYEIVVTVPCSHDRPTVIVIHLRGTGTEAGPPAATPEASSVLFLPVSALGALGLVAGLRRLRSRRGLPRSFT